MGITEYKEDLFLWRAPPRCRMFIPVPIYYFLFLMPNLNFMHLAYSALNVNPISPASVTLQPDEQNELQLRYLAYQNTCDKYCNEIAAIQKYLPGWTPKFR